MSDKTVLLPSQEEILQRLMAVNSDSHPRDNFYPLLMEEAGKRLTAEGVATKIQLAVEDYTKDTPIMSILLKRQMNRFIDALCPDQEIAAEAKEFFREALESLK